MLKARRQIAAGTEEECLDGAEAHSELVGDLRIRESLPLAQKNGPTLALGKMGEPVSKRGAMLIHFVAGGRWRGELVDVLDLVHDRALAAGRPPRPSADVERDLEQPGELELRLDAALQGAQHVDEGRLRRVLCLLTVAKSAVAEREHPLAVLFVQVARQLCRLGRPGDRGMAEEGAHRAGLPIGADGVPPSRDVGTVSFPTLASSIACRHGGMGP